MMGWMDVVRGDMESESKGPRFEVKCPSCSSERISIEWRRMGRDFEVKGDWVVYNYWMECSDCRWKHPVDREVMEEADRYEWTETIEKKYSVIDMEQIMEKST